MAAIRLQSAQGAALPASFSDRLMSIVELFLEHPSMTLTDVSTHTGFDPATATRYIRRLEQHRWLERNPATKEYLLGTMLIALGSRAVDSHPIRRRLLPHMYHLLELYNETTNLASYQRGSWSSSTP